MDDPEFEILLSKADFKFNCAHFIAYKGFRERLHGHNYQVSVKIVGSNEISEQGYLIDFGDVKKIVRKLCKSINEYFICPMKSKDIVITEIEGQVCMECEDGSKFSFPKADCALLPIQHSSAEELAHWLWCNIIRELGFEKLQNQSLRQLEVSVAESHMQMATFRSKVPSNEAELAILENRRLHKLPAPCFSEES